MLLFFFKKVGDQIILFSTRSRSVERTNKNSKGANQQISFLIKMITQIKGFKCYKYHYLVSEKLCNSHSATVFILKYFFSHARIEEKYGKEQCYFSLDIRYQVTRFKVYCKIRREMSIL